MKYHTIKTTLTFSSGFLQIVRDAAKERGLSMSRLLENELTAVLKEQEERKLTKLYATLRKWQGSGGENITDASQTIDETLYGDNGSWKGKRAK